ncbi:MAG: DUF4988 and DUF4465 domain-containing protein [Rikenellaceae bacterium]|jgi:hypothetical protein|nr:DUF4988 and DUF4465 domain-containing protein [Rikenellaceae bacterium]
MKKLFATLFVVAALAGCKYDDSDLRDSIGQIENRLKTLEERVAGMNSDISSMQTIVEGLNAGKVIAGVTESATGYSITFSNGDNIFIRHGAKGDDAPAVGVRKEGGIYYWTVTTGATTSWLLDDLGNKLPVSGTDGASGTTPAMGVDGEGYWTVDVGGGPTRILSRGNPVKAAGVSGDSFFSNVTEDADKVTFTLSDGGTIVVPRAGGMTCIVECMSTEHFKYGQARLFDMTQNGVVDFTLTKPDGWRVAVTDDGKLSVTAPAAANTFAERGGTVSVVAAGRSVTVIVKFSVEVSPYHIVHFEDAADYLAGPTAYGENLYSTAANQYVGYYDTGSDLYMMINDDVYGIPGYNFWNGGVAISQWNDMSLNEYLNQCSVYYRDPKTGFGGHNGSKTFAVGYGNNNTDFGVDCRPSIFFGDPQAEYEFDHFWIASNAYAYLSITQGDSFGPAYSHATHDWFKLVIEGVDKDGSSTGTVEYYLADYRTPSSPGTLDRWVKVDLGQLGAVNRLRFDIQASDNNGYGTAKPVYFCFDDIAIVK